MDPRSPLTKGLVPSLLKCTNVEKIMIDLHVLLTQTQQSSIHGQSYFISKCPSCSPPLPLCRFEANPRRHIYFIYEHFTMCLKKIRTFIPFHLMAKGHIGMFLWTRYLPVTPSGHRDRQCGACVVTWVLLDWVVGETLPWPVPTFLQEADALRPESPWGTSPPWSLLRGEGGG